MDITICLKFTGTHFKGDVLVNGINQEKNELDVTCTLNGHSWNEVWNLQHTIWGFDDGEYFLKPE